MPISWHHLIIYFIFLLLGAYLVGKFPQINLIGKVLP